MKRLLASVLLVAGLLTLPAPLVAAGDTSTAWLAYLKGDREAAVAELRGLSQEGDPEAQYALATAYSDGLALPQDYRRAAEWYEMAARQGHGGAQFNLGLLYYTGAGEGEGQLPRDHAEAARWLTPAAEAGNPMAAFLLSRLYQHGSGVTADQEAALRWSRLAAQRGLVGGQFETGVLLGDRRADAAAWIEAYSWLLLAARQGHPAAAENLDILAKRLNHKEIEDAEAAAATWSPTP